MKKTISVTAALCAIIIGMIFPCACKKAAFRSADTEKATARALAGNKRLFGYITWPGYIDSVDASLVTDVDLIIGHDNTTGLPLSGADVTGAVTKAHNKGLRIFITLGGSPTFYQPQNRAAFIHNLRIYLTGNNFDGIDLDYEGGEITSDYSGFIIQLSDTLRQYSKLMSLAINHGWGEGVSLTAYSRFDFINAMIYDYLYPGNPQPHASFAQFQQDVEYFLTKVPAAKINAGIPAYAWRYVNLNQAGQTSFKNIAGTYYNGPFVNKWPVSSNEQWFYDGHPVVKQKIAYAVRKGLGGIMQFALDYDTRDDRTSLLKLINYCFSDTSGFNHSDKYSLPSIYTGQPMTITGASKNDGAAAIVSGAFPTASYWNIGFTGNGHFGIFNNNSGKALDVTGASIANGAPLAQWPWWQGSNQLYTMTPDVNGIYILTNVKSGKAIGVAGDGVSVVQNSPNGSYAQQWALFKQ